MDGNVVATSEDIHPLSDIPIGWMKNDPMPARTVLAYHTLDGHLFCYAANMDTEFTQLTPTEGHLRIQPSGRANSWQFRNDNNSIVEIRDALNTNTTWFENVWNFVRRESKKVNAAPPLPFRDAADYIDNHQLRDMYVMADRMHREPTRFNLPPNSGGRNNDRREEIVQAFVGRALMFAERATDIMYQYDESDWSGGALRTAEEALWSAFGSLVKGSVEAREREHSTTTEGDERDARHRITVTIEDL